MLRFIILWLFLSGLAAPTAGADLTLQDALRAAVTYRPTVKEAQAQASAAKAVISETRSRWLPHVTISELYVRTDEPAGSLFLALNQERNVMADPNYDMVNPDDKDDFETRLQLAQTIYDPTVDYELRRARTAGKSADASAAWSAEEAAFTAFQAYLDVQQTIAALDWVESSRQEAAEIARLAIERHRAGTGLKADTLRAEVQLAEARRRELAARNDLTLARRRLALATGRPGGEEGIAAPLDETSFPANPVTTIDQRADLMALSLQTEDAGLAVSQSKAEWLPRLGLTAHYAWHDEDAPFGSDAESWAIGAGLTWEIFDGMRRNAATARATAEHLAANSRLDEARREREFRLGEAILRAEEARLQRESARQAVVAADESRRLLQQRFETGLTDLVDLLAAQTALDRARFDANGAESRHLMALGAIHFQAGNFLQAFLHGEEVPR